MSDSKNLIILAAVGMGAYLLMTRSAGAATLPNGQRTTANGAAQVPRIFGSSPTAAIQPQGAGNQGMINAGINLISQLLSNGNNPLVRSPGYTPGYFPDTTGEAAAQAYYSANPDAFAVNPPTSFNSDPQLYVSTGGYLDSQ